MEERSGALRVLEPGQAVRDDVEGAVYRIIRFIGRGGMGEVYEVARDDSGARFALKCLQLQHAGSPTVIERARLEARVLREIRHPNVIRVHASGVRADGVIWMVMELLVGHTLQQIKAELGKLPVAWALRIARDTCEGLAVMHNYAVHRDVKPENVHLGRDTVVRVLDLGAGKFHRVGLATSGGAVFGTVPYMSPEQIRTPAYIDARSDLFSIGIILYELLSGVHPYAPKGVASANVFTLIRAIIDDAHPPLSSTAPWVPPHVVAIVERALRKNRDERQGSAAELSAEIAAAMARYEREIGGSQPLETLTAALDRMGTGSGPRAPVAALAPTVPFSPDGRDPRGSR